MIDTTDPRVREVLRSVGAWYQWGAGTLADGPTRWPLGPFDCSGYAQAAAGVTGIIRPDAWHDKGAMDIANECDPLAGSKAQQAAAALFGDFSFYPGHVMFCIGDGMCIGASGGNKQTTKANNPKARVVVVPITYRGDLLVVGRLKEPHRLER